MLTPYQVRQPREPETESRAELTAQHHAYVKALRSHAELLRDLDQTMRLIADAMEEAGLQDAQRARVTAALDAHIDRARSAIATIDRTLTTALGTDGAVRH